MPEINDLANHHESKVKFAIVYIMEAHASDEWPIGDLDPGVAINQHRSIEERIEAAKMFQKKYSLSPNIDFLVDTMDNSFNSMFESWPTRAWIISPDGRVCFKSMPGDGSGACVNLNDLTCALKELEMVDLDE